MNAVDTPLMGGASVELPSDFKGITPQRKEVATPNVLASATPQRGPASSSSSVSGSVRSMATPLRDGLSINDAESVSGMSVASEAARMVREGCATLAC